MNNVNREVKLQQKSMIDLKQEERMNRETFTIFQEEELMPDSRGEATEKDIED